jgi:peptidoglycan/xylan/chitin deacetylase (PgdA/CDA1 family)
MASRAAFLMYHELEIAGRPLCQPGAGYARYVVSREAFRDHLARMKAAGFAGLNVSQWLDRPAPAAPAVVITFDDGCETDLIAAAPLLAELGFQATFYVVAGFTGEGRRGYLNPAQLRELAAAGFEIGCHSMTHAYLPDLDAAGLRSEITDARSRLEQMLGSRVDHYSCPGGRWSAAAAAVAREAGFRSMTTSRIGVNARSDDLFRLTRIAVLRTTPAGSLVPICRGQGLWLRRASDALLGSAKAVLGNAGYEKLRGFVLRH